MYFSSLAIILLPFTFLTSASPLISSSSLSQLEPRADSFSISCLASYSFAGRNAIFNPPWQASDFRSLDDLCWAGPSNAGCSCLPPYGWVVCNSPPGVPAIRLSPAAGACYEHCVCTPKQPAQEPPKKKLKQSDYCVRGKSTPCADNLWCNILNNPSNLGLTFGAAGPSGSASNPVNLDTLFGGFLGFCAQISA